MGGPTRDRVAIELWPVKSTWQLRAVRKGSVNGVMAEGKRETYEHALGLALLWRDEIRRSGLEVEVRVRSRMVELVPGSPPRARFTEN